MVRALASHWRGPGSILSSDHMWAKFVVGSFSAPRGVSPGPLVLPSPQKPALLNSNSIRNAQTFNTWASGSRDWATTPHVIELKQLDFFFVFLCTNHSATLYSVNGIQYYSTSAYYSHNNLFGITRRRSSCCHALIKRWLKMPISTCCKFGLSLIF